MGKRKTQPVMEGDTLSDSESGDLDSVSPKKISLRILLIDVILLRLLAELQKIFSNWSRFIRGCAFL